MKHTVRGARGRELCLDPERPRIMGVVNLTPDSFSDGGLHASADAAVDAALRLEAEGADILDLGAESSRPGSDPVGADAECARLLPVLERLRRRSEVTVSIDTTKACVAAEAIERGADWINDVSALGADPEMASVCAASGAAVVLVHMRGSPKTMQDAPHYDDALREIVSELGERVDEAEAAGIDRDRILIDPGIGFGKRHDDNLAIVRGLERIGSIGRPVVLGASRKSFLGRILEREGVGPTEPAERDIATLGVVAVGHRAGVSVHRVHAVRYARNLLSTLAGIGRPARL